MAKENLDVDKATFNDKRKMLSDAIDSGWVMDFDEEYVYFEQWEEDGYVTYRKSYNISEGNSVTFGEEKEKVVATTDFQVVKAVNETEKSVIGYVTKALDKYFGGSNRKDLNVIKQFGDDGDMTCIEPLYTAPFQADGDGDMMSAETIEGMVQSINKANDEGRLQSGLFHKHNTDTWHLEKAWVNPTECIIGDTVVPEGQPIAKTVFTNEAAFELRKSGDIAGLSIGARATDIVDLNKSASELAAIQKSPEAKREIVGTHFDWEHPELTYTSRAQGGAAHMQNDILNVAKAKKATKADLLDEEVEILKEIGEEFVSLEKHLGDDKDNTPSSDSTAGNTGEDTKLDKGNTKTMSDQMVTREEFEQLQKSLQVQKAVNILMKYELDAELNKALAGAIADLDDDGAKAVIDTMDALVARSEEVEKAASEKTSDSAEETELQKALSEDAGDAGEPESEVEKSFIDRIMAEQDAQNGGAK